MTEKKPNGVVAINVIPIADKILIIAVAEKLEGDKKESVSIPFGLIDGEPWSDPICQAELKTAIEGWVYRLVTKAGATVIHGPNKGAN